MNKKTGEALGGCLVLIMIVGAASAMLGSGQSADQAGPVNSASSVRSIDAVAHPERSPGSTASKLDIHTTYTGPDNKRAVAAASMDVLQKHCFRVVMYLDRFTGLSAAYIELPDQDRFGEMAGFRTIMLSFTWKPGAWPVGALHEDKATFIMVGGQGRGITTSGSGAWLCNTTVARGKQTVFIPAPELSLSDP